jgi:dTDP-4-dehydrorhamnose reductase
LNYYRENAVKILIVGANGLLGSGAVAALSAGNEIVQASRSGEVSVDLTDPKGSIEDLINTETATVNGPTNP